MQTIAYRTTDGFQLFTSAKCPTATIQTPNNQIITLNRYGAACALVVFRKFKTCTREVNPQPSL